MAKRRLFSAIFFVIFFLVLTQTTVLAHELELPKTGINPNNYLLYSMKRLVEKAVVFTKITQESKTNYYKDLTYKRMAELKTVVDQNLLSEVQHSTERLSYEVGILSDYVSANKTDTSIRNQEISHFLEDFKGPLATLRDQYPANSPYWLLIQHNINSIDINLEKLK